MTRRRENDRKTMPPPVLNQAELGQSKAFEDRRLDGPPAETFVFLPDGSAMKVLDRGDATPANDTDW